MVGNDLKLARFVPPRTCGIVEENAGDLPEKPSVCRRSFR